MTAANVEAVKEIYRSAVDRVQPRAVLDRCLERQGSELSVGGERFGSAEAPVYALAIGKASGEMLAEVERIVGDRLVGGFAVTKFISNDLSLRSRMVTGSHPVPDQRSLDVGEELLAFARSIPEGARVICLISGGGSALVESLRGGVSVEDLQRVTRELLNAGASIHELNAVRARMSEIKAGGLLSALRHTSVVNIVISDVLGDDLATIASGPTVPPGESESGEEVLRRYGVRFELPKDAGRGDLPAPRTVIAGNLSIAIDAAADKARELGYKPVVLTRSLTGEARHVAGSFAAILADTRNGSTSFQPGTCFIGGGETTVTVSGTGSGGRNTESALAAAIRLSGIDRVVAGFLASDGDDAETGVAGGIVTGQTVQPEAVADARAALARNDSYTWLSHQDAVWGLGPTGTNVNDLIIGIVS